MQLDDGRPIFQQVAHELSRRIARGALKPGDKLPTVREMALEFRVNPNTIQRACQELEGQGAVTSRRGHGIFVTDDAGILERLRHEMVTEAVNACVRELRALGLDSPTMLKAFEAGLAQSGMAGTAAADQTEGSEST